MRLLRNDKDSGFCNASAQKNLAAGRIELWQELSCSKRHLAGSESQRFPPRCCRQHGDVVVLGVQEENETFSIIP